MPLYESAESGSQQIPYSDLQNLDIPQLDTSPSSGGAGACTAEDDMALDADVVDGLADDDAPYDPSKRYDPTLVFASIADHVLMDVESPDEFHDLTDDHRHSGANCPYGPPAKRGPTIRKGVPTRRKRAARMGMLLLLGLAALAGTIYLFASGANSTDDGGNDEAIDRGKDEPVDGTALQGGGDGAQLPPLIASAPTDLAELCSEEAIATAEGYDACKDGCEPSACCHLPPDDSLSCLSSNVELCADYEVPCHNLGTHNHEAYAAETLVAVSSSSPVAAPEPARPEEVDAIRAKEGAVANATVDAQSTHVSFSKETLPTGGSVATLCTPEAYNTPEGYKACVNQVRAALP